MRVCIYVVLTMCSVLPGCTKKTTETKNTLLPPLPLDVLNALSLTASADSIRYEELPYFEDSTVLVLYVNGKVYNSSFDTIRCLCLSCPPGYNQCVSDSISFYLYPANVCFATSIGFQYFNPRSSTDIQFKIYTKGNEWAKYPIKVGYRMMIAPGDMTLNNISFNSENEKSAPVLWSNHISLKKLASENQIK